MNTDNIIISENETVEDSAGASKKVRLSMAVAIAAIVLAVIICWASFHPMALVNVKDITVNVEHTDGTVSSFVVATREDNLYDAVAELGIFEGTRSEEIEITDDGEIVETEGAFTLTAVDGETADAEQGQYWLHDRNGTYSSANVEEQAVADGDVFDFYIYTYVTETGDAE